MNPILLIGMLAAAFFLGKASEEVEGKSNLAQTIFLSLYAGEVLYISYCFLTLPTSVLSTTSYLITGSALWFLFYLGAKIVILKRRIKNLEEAK